MIDKYHSVNKEKKMEGILQPDATFPGSMLCGKYWIGVFLVFLSVLWFIPWDDLYRNPIYFQFVQFMATIYPNIHGIANTKSQFPEFAMALVAFCGAVGPFFVFFYFYFGFIHPKSVDFNIIENVSFKDRLLLVFGSIFMFLLFIFLPFVWDGSSFYAPKLFFESKVAFVAWTLVIWWVVCAASFGFTGIVTVFTIAKRYH